ncbi:MAG: UDP-N-acetylmuramoyl-L-alanine--D-glutamate ligase [Candidatus Doudnabacteria bacterium]|nr:UDP-N-acetylmuramoyl-L-alanine--D-glutamate ligase [Candidatus Doudnabacteria bacterium]
MLDFLGGKKIAILGFGKEGQATFEFLKQNRIFVNAVLDKEKPTVEVPANVELITGPGYLDGLSNFDYIFRSPGFPRMHPKLIEFSVQENILSHIKLFLRLCPCPVIAVTGTKGKTTTTSLIYEILKNSKEKVFLGGNMGVPPLGFLNELDKSSIVILELSSFQTIDLDNSPHVGVILAVTHDHLDDGTFKPSSHSTLGEYLQAKAQMIAKQNENDFAILHSGLNEIFKKSGMGKKIFFEPNDALLYKHKLLGKHNLENIAAAAKACSVVGVSEEAIKSGIQNFSGVAQRLQLVAKKNEIAFINDSASTNPDSTIAAVDSFDNNITLILGGSRKGLDYTELGEKIVSSKQVKDLVIIGEVTDEIGRACSGFQGRILTGAKNMKEIIDQALSLTEAGGTVLFSPAAASFDMFKNSKDRGNQFDQIVNSI